MVKALSFARNLVAIVHQLRQLPFFFLRQHRSFGSSLLFFCLTTFLTLLSRLLHILALQTPPPNRTIDRHANNAAPNNHQPGDILKMAVKHTRQLPTRHIPHPNILIPTPRNHPPPLLIQRNRPHIVRMQQHGVRRPGPLAGQALGRAVRAGRPQVGIGVEGEREHARVVAQQRRERRDRFARRQRHLRRRRRTQSPRPDLAAAVAAEDRERGVRGGRVQRERLHAARVALERVQQSAAGERPDTDGGVRRGGDEEGVAAVQRGGENCFDEVGVAGEAVRLRAAFDAGGAVRQRPGVDAFVP